MYSGIMSSREGKEEEEVEVEQELEQVERFERTLMSVR
jgi:hypothetical protein